MSAQQGSHDAARGDAGHRATRPAITRLSAHDVLMGRGAPIAYYRGNVAFREIVRPRKQEYIAAKCHQRKQDIAKELYAEVGRIGGRFLAKMDPTEAALQGVPAGEKAWFIVDEDVALEKVKQALREKDASESSVPAVYLPAEEEQAPPSHVARSEGIETAMAPSSRSGNPVDTQNSNLLLQRAILQQQMDQFSAQAARLPQQSQNVATLGSSVQPFAVQGHLALSNLNQTGGQGAPTPALSLSTHDSLLARLAAASSGQNSLAMAPIAGIPAPASTASSATSGANTALDLSMLLPSTQQSAVPAALFQNNTDVASQRQQLELVLRYRQQQELVRQQEQQQLGLQQLLLMQQLQSQQNATHLPSVTLSGTIPGVNNINSLSVSGLATNPIQNFASAAAPVSFPQGGILDQLLAQGSQSFSSPNASRLAPGVAAAAAATASAIDPTMALLRRNVNNERDTTATLSSAAELPHVRESGGGSDRHGISSSQHQSNQVLGAQESESVGHGAALNNDNRAASLSPHPDGLDGGNDEDRKPQARKRERPKDLPSSSSSEGSEKVVQRISRQKKT